MTTIVATGNSDDFAPPSLAPSLQHGLAGLNLSGRFLQTTFWLKDVPARFLVANEEFVSNTDEGNIEVAQRELDLPKAEAIAVYVLKAAVARAVRTGPRSPQLISLVNTLFGSEELIPHYFALPTLEAAVFKEKLSRWASERLIVTQSVAVVKFQMPEGERLWLVDGQHRWKGICILFDFFSKEIASRRISDKGILRKEAGLAGLPVSSSSVEMWQQVENALHQMMIGVQLHTELTDWSQLQQAFADMNLNQKKAPTSLGHSWNMNNPLTAWLKGEMSTLFAGCEEKIDKSSNDSKKIRFDDDNGAMSLKDVVGITATLVAGKLSPNGMTAQQVQMAANTITAFWTAVRSAGVFKPGAKEASLLAQPVVLKGLALLVYQLRRRFAKKKPHDYQKHLKSVLNSIKPDADLWRHIAASGEPNIWVVLDRGYQDENSREPRANEHGTDIWSVVSSTGPLGDITQKFETNVYRFGPKTNDVRRVVADVVRWQLNLPLRTARKLVSP